MPRRRIIPAHAGNSGSVDQAYAARPDHPRACGGTPSYDPKTAVLYRIIPAHAGNSSVPKRPICERSDHPRACGELAV